MGEFVEQSLKAVAVTLCLNQLMMVKSIYKI